MRRKKNLFSSANELDALIAQYFEQITGNPTMAGLAFHLGFNSREDFEEYELNGKFADQLKRARLRIAADYEKKLHATSSAGAIFALKSMGWNEKPDQKSADESENHVLKVEIIQSGPPLSATEAEVTFKLIQNEC